MEIVEAKYIISSPSFDQCPSTSQPEIAFIGRSNVGKSSLINMLCRNKNLAKTSATPGKTQLINHFAVRSTQQKKTSSWFVVDLPGYGFAKVSQSSRRRWEQMIEGYIRKRTSLAQLFVLVDSRHEPQRLDLDFINQLGKWEAPFAIIFTKADKNKPMATQRHVNAFLQAMQEFWEQPPHFFVSSALTGDGRAEILNYINQIIN
jgi:GTP-binding protein